jgi:hypothetical protein
MLLSIQEDGTGEASVTSIRVENLPLGRWEVGIAMKLKILG